MLLKPQDVLVTLKLACQKPGWSYASLAQSLAISVSETHAAIRRAQRCRLLSLQQSPEPGWAMLHQFLLHGLPVVLPLTYGPPAKGILTSYAAPPLQGLLFSADDALPPIWIDPQGSTRGISVVPLYPSVPEAARADHQLYEWLVLADALRSHEPRTRQIAQPELDRRIRDLTTTSYLGSL